MGKLVYICSPLRGAYEDNIDNAIMYSREAFNMGYIPITPHIYFTRFSDDTNERERAKAMNAGLQLLRMCSEVWVFGLDHPTEGMQAEIAEAIRHNIKVKDGEKMITYGRIQKARPVMDADIVARHVEWLTKNFGPVVADRWKRTNKKYAMALVDNEQIAREPFSNSGHQPTTAIQSSPPNARSSVQKLVVPMQKVGTSASRAAKSVAEALKKGAGHDGCSTI